MASAPPVYIAPPSTGALRVGLGDFVESLRRWRLWTLLGWTEIRQRYARSRLGPFWLTISTGVMILCVGLVFGVLFHQSMQQYLPLFGVGLIVWTLISTIVNEGATAYVNAASYMRQIHSPRLIYIFQAVWRNLIIFFHNLVIVACLMAIFGVRHPAAIALAVPGLLLLLLNASWMGALAGLVSTRYRDVPQLITSLMLVGFYVTPVMYERSMLKSHAGLLLYNPFTYLLTDLRRPFLGEYPSPRDWLIAAAMAVVGWVVVIALTGRYHRRLSYWL